MEYAVTWIIRFEGTLTQGPNAGKAYTFASSWGGKLYRDVLSAHAALAQYRALEPGLKYKLVRRQCDQAGRMVETDVPV